MITSKNFLYLIIGGFSLILFLDCSYLLALIFKDVFIQLELNHFLIFFIYELLQIIFFILFLVYGLKYLKNKSSSFTKLKNVVIKIIITFIIVQLIQTLFILYFNNLDILEAKIHNYTDSINKNYLLHLISSFTYYFQLLIFTLFLFNFIKKNDY